MRKRRASIRKRKLFLSSLIGILTLVVMLVSMIRKDEAVKAGGSIEEIKYKDIKTEAVVKKMEHVIVKPEDLEVMADDDKETENESCMIDVPYICQKPEYPTGCESVSAVMALQYYGVDILVSDFIDNYLATSEYYWDEDGLMHGPAPWQFFVGNPRETNGFGCYATVIEAAVEKLCGEGTVVNTSGTDLSVLCHQYLDNKQPVLVWASMGMTPTKEGRSWMLESGEKFTWIAGEHCLVLVGYDRDNYYFNDPLVGEKIAYEKALVEKRYKELKMQSLVFCID